MFRYDDTAGGDDTLIGWNGRGLAETIDVASDAGPVSSEAFAYGPDGARHHRKSVWKDGSATRTEHTFYAGAFEERLLDGHADYASVQKTRVGGGIVQVRTLSHPDPANNNKQTAASSLEYLHRDHLGSVEAVTDASGARLATLAYDPFGARRKPDWTRSLNSGEVETLADDLKLKVSRGYSDHEHLDRAGFVHMNGRVYDPRTGRFLSPDPVVEDPAFSQSWHSYSYVANSPLSLADPTGLFAQCPIPTLGFSCDPAASPGGFGGAIDTVFSLIHRYWFDFYVYRAPSFSFAIGDEGIDVEFDVVDLIGVAVSVASQVVKREVRVEDQSETHEPMDHRLNGKGASCNTCTSEEPDVVGNLDLDRAAIRILDMLEDLPVEQSVAIRVREDGEYYPGRTRTGTGHQVNMDIYADSVAGVHTHPPARSKSITRKKELPGPRDHDLVNRGYPNYIKTPRGDIRVLERINGEFRVRTVRGQDVRGQQRWKPGTRDVFGRRRL